MNFHDEVVESLNMNDVDQVFHLVNEHLCGERHLFDLSARDRQLLSALLKNAREKSLNYEQFNELLLVVGQGRVSRDFFKFFFQGDSVSLEGIRDGVIRFKTYAMLCFGNYRFAYKQLFQKNEAELKDSLDPYYERGRVLAKRPARMINLEEIPQDQTWYTGYISKRKLEKETEFLNSVLRSENDSGSRAELLESLKPFASKMAPEDLYKRYLELAKKHTAKYQAIKKDVEAADRKALDNTDTYLTWDYMDVYVATSMRHKWEFGQTFSFVQEVFSRKVFEDGTNNPIPNLDLRYFDPTQSLCRNRIDKGLVEGLMLRRAYCTIYMVQESDTMGKDSELAATLAQGKPVIAYVPTINPETFAKDIQEKYPLEFFEKRSLFLIAEGLLGEQEIRLVEEFRKALSDFRIEQPFGLIEEEEAGFKKSYSGFPKLCSLVAAGEKQNFDRRASTLQATHPLGLQVNLRTGVANGVLVVRSARDCALVLSQLISNSCDFRIVHRKLFDLAKKDAQWLQESLPDRFAYDERSRTLDLRKHLMPAELRQLIELANRESCPLSLKPTLQRFSSEGVTVLEEGITRCVFRAVTNDDKLTNSFWNFYPRDVRRD